jgi:ubiquinone/menaquinone biosynthesis C-methylase UbiE
MLSTRAADYGVQIAYVNLVGGQDELVFDGDSMVFAADGELIAESPTFEEHLLICDIESQRAFRQRLHDPRRRQVARSFPESVRVVELPEINRRPEKRPLEPTLKLLEISCGRGGGLNAFISAARGTFDATGLDVAASAIAFCRSTYGENDRLRFVEGSALELPFPDASFDVALNVEASNDYGDRPRFFSEVARVLKPDGVFVYTDSFRTADAEQMKQELAAAGFEAEFSDITANVAEACRLDSPRRRELIDRQAPLVGKLMFRRQLENYAAVEGSGKYRQFAERRRAYLMTAAVKR